MRVQFELLDTGVWNLDEVVMLPGIRLNSNTRFVRPLHKSQLLPANINSAASEFGPADLDAYFLAEIAMRRISHRCASSVRKKPSGDFEYAPLVASELTHQLEEWYEHLPAALQFSRAADADLQDTSGLLLFLRTQYYSCMTSVHWPAIVEALQTSNSAYEVRIASERFFEAYHNFMVSVSFCVDACPVNRWTLLASSFAFTMAALRATKDPTLNSTNPYNIYGSVSLVMPCFERFAGISPSLTHLHKLLGEQLQEGR